MSDAIRLYLPWLLSAITITSTLMAGNKHRLTWVVAGANQVLWLAWIVASENWGLLPLTCFLAAIYVRNHFMWKHAG